MNLYNLEYEEKIFNDSRYEMIIRINLEYYDNASELHMLKNMMDDE